jgi:tricorn protease
VDRESGIYALALRDDVPNPFPPRSDEVGDDGKSADDEDDEGASDSSGPSGAVPPMRIDFEGLGERVARVPVEYDNYTNLATVKGHLLYRRTSPFYYGRPAGVDPALKLFSLEDRKEKTLAEDANGYALSADGKKALVRSCGAARPTSCTT